MSILKASLAAMIVATAACGGIEDVEVGSTGSALTPCPTCDPDTNAQGIVNIEGGWSCLRTPGDGDICPMAFSNVPNGGGVNIQLRRKDNTALAPVAVSARYGSNSVALTSITAQQTNVVVSFILRNQAYSVSGSSLANLTFSFTFGASSIDLRLTDGAGGPVQVNGVWEHNITARLDGGSWAYLCTDDRGLNEPASLIQGAFIDPMDAHRTGAPNVSMLGCKKGGITTCMEWGYKPWQIGWNEGTGQIESLIPAHLSCIQMKRAAYCGTDSWTENGTSIYLDDAYNIHSVMPQRLEAIWTPDGAICVNQDNMRHPELGFDGVCPNGIKPDCSNFPSENFWWNAGAYTADGI